MRKLLAVAMVAGTMMLTAQPAPAEQQQAGWLFVAHNPDGTHRCAPDITCTTWHELVLGFVCCPH